VRVTVNRFIIYTWGCQMNEDDSEQISSLLMQMGLAPTQEANEADIAVLVTCSVRAKPEQKAKSKLGELRILKEQRPWMIIGVCGCMAQREGSALRKGRPYLDFVVGTAAIHQIPDIIRRIEERRSFAAALDMPEQPGDAARSLPQRVDRQGTALKSFLPAMYGCDNYCAYCVVPYVRGRERSRPLDEIVEEATQLAALGRKEITLLGQNVNSYGATLGISTDFADLLRKVSEVAGIERIRFTTSHPKDLSDRLIEAMAELPKVCEHIHLAVQSGDDEVLARMNRKYTSAVFRERVAALRSAMPDIAITTDLLVGFPGETQEQFENTLRLVEDVRFDSAFMFSFNPIPRTAAAAMDGHLTERVKMARLNRLIELQNEITSLINASQVGRTYEVLVEGISPKHDGRLTGLTRQNKTANFPGSVATAGQFVRVRATQSHLYGFVGEIDNH